MWLFFFFLIIDIALIDAASSSRTTTVPNSKKAATTKMTRKLIPRRTTSGSRLLGKTTVDPPVNDENEEMMKKADKTLKVLFAVSVALIPVLRRIDDERDILILDCFSVSILFTVANFVNDYLSKKFFESNTPPQIMSKAIDVISKTCKYACFGLVAIGVSKFLDSLFIVRDVETIKITAWFLGFCWLGALISKGPKWAQDCLQILCNVSLALTVILMVISYCKRSWWNQVVNGF